MATGVNNVGPSLLPGRISGGVARAVRAGAQPDSMPMVAVSIARIGDLSDLDITPIPVALTQDLHDTLGDYGTDNDGWEQLLGDMELAIGDDAAGLDKTNAGLGDITDTDNGAFEANTWGHIISDHANFVTAQQTLLDKLGNDSNISAGPPSPPPPPPPPPPPGTGGGGGGGGTGGGCTDPAGCECEGTGANVDGSDRCVRF